MMKKILTCIMALLPVVAFAQRQITGTVTDKKGAPLAGVSVMVAGTVVGALSSETGAYSIIVPNETSVLRFSFMGFGEVEKAVGTLQVIDVTLDESNVDLDEVIVVAYGTQKKSSVTGSIAVVKEAELKTVTSPNVNAMLQGKVAGVQVVNTSGKPGEAAQIRIRGKGSIGSSLDPLWVIDGVVAGIGAPLNPNEIASISVLKDAAATALYGSRATNGVIIVTTKSGGLGDGKLQVSAKMGVAQQQLGNFRLMNSQELYDYTESMSGKVAAGLSSWFTDDLLKNNTNWFDEATQNALSQNYNVSYTTGGEKWRSFLMADLYNEEGTVKGFEYTRYSLRSNTDYVVNQRLTIKTKFSGSYYNNLSQQHDLYSAMTYLPWDVPYNADGTLRNGKEADWHGRDGSNYMYNLPMNWSRGKAAGVSANVGFDFKITDWLTFESNNNVGLRYTLDEEYEDPHAQGAEGYSGGIRDANAFYTTRYTNQLLRFAKIIGDKHSVSAFLGYEFSDSRSETNEATAHGIPSGSEVLDVAASPYSTKGNISEWAMQSGYFNANYTYDDRYMAQFSYRIDGSSRFGKNNRYGNFFTIGAGWALHNEAFMSGITGYVNQLKLRGSYGSIGNVPSSNYGYMSVFSLGTQYGGVPSAFPSRLGNPDLTWEKCYETNIALEARIVDRVGLQLEWYDKNTSDLLYNVALASVTGYSSQWRNVGAVRNRGMEITLSPDIVRSNGVLWTADLNIGFNKATIEELYEGKPQITGSDMAGEKIREEGKAMDTWYLREWAGVDVYTGEPMWYIHNDDGTRTLTSNRADATRTYMGSSNPDFSGGLITTASYKGLTLSAGFNFVYGNMVYNYARQYYDADGAYPQYNSMALADGWVRWTQPGDIATHPQAIAGGNHDSNRSSSRYLEDGSYLKFTTLSLSYALPERWLKPVMIKSLNVTFAGENLWTLTKFSGPNPEVSVGQDGTADAGHYPMPRRFSLSLNLTF
ncbi:MAG: TonB-dependent receptor [Prevotellaceae bacterium]|nr:TonB-dependent receptor [Prevotellaceae bacterium]